MFRIYDGREEFYQWDKDRKIIVDDASIKEVHFCNKTGPCSLVSEVYFHDDDFGGLYVANVPNVLLETSWRIHVYGYTGDYTKHTACFTVNARTKPEDYVHTDEELKTWEELEERVEALEQGGGGSTSEYTQPEWGSKQGKIQTKKYSEYETVYLTPEEYESVVAVYEYSYDMDEYYEIPISACPLQTDEEGNTYIYLYEGYVVIETEGEVIKPIPAKYLEIDDSPIMVVHFYTVGYDDTDTWSADKTPEEVLDAIYNKGKAVIALVRYEYPNARYTQYLVSTEEESVVYIPNSAGQIICCGYAGEGWFNPYAYSLRKEAGTE